MIFQYRDSHWLFSGDMGGCPIGPPVYLYKSFLSCHNRQNKSILRIKNGKWEGDTEYEEYLLKEVYTFYDLMKKVMVGNNYTNPVSNAPLTPSPYWRFYNRSEKKESFIASCQTTIILDHNTSRFHDLFDYLITETVEQCRIIEGCMCFARALDPVLKVNDVNMEVGNA